MWLYNIPLMCPSLPPSSVYDSFIPLLYSHSLWGATYRGPGKSTLFVSAVIGWDELSCVSVPITSSSAGCRKREGERSRRNTERERKGARGNGVLPLPGTLIRQRRRPLSQYSQNRQHQGGSVWHTGKVIMTVGVSLEWTNHCFTWLNGDVQKRHSLGQEQSLSVALSSKGRWKRSREFIGLKCSVYMYANNWTQ